MLPHVSQKKSKMYCAYKYEVKIILQSVSLATIMERYGFFFSHSEHQLDKFSYFHSELYRNLSECIQVTRDWESTDRRVYFKILSNTEIVSLINVKKSKKKLGFISLCSNCIAQNDYLILSYATKLYEDILECIVDGKSHLPQKEDETDNCLNRPDKIGYFYVLNDDDMVSELHTPCVV